MAPTEELLTEDEKRALTLTGELVNLISGRIIGDAPSRAGDVNEVVGHIHALQRMLMAQAAARAYPSEYRLLGGAVKEASGGPDR